MENLKFAWIEYAASFFLHLMTWKHESVITAKFFLNYENFFTFLLGLHIDLAVCKSTLYSKSQFLEYGHFQNKWLQSVTLGVKIQCGGTKRSLSRKLAPLTPAQGYPRRGRGA